jgi:hypothetical protein
MQVETIVTRLLTRPSPYRRMPMKPASRKKAVSASMQIIGPRIGPTARA